MRASLIAIALCLTACQGAGSQGPATSAAPGGTCNSEALARFVGRTVDEAIGAEMLQASGAKTLRWGGPGMAMTMDYREDRLTVSYDEKRVITQVSCG
ncbi:MAG: I78 family peptidase inhibitor [Sphingobium sp.]